MIADNVVVAGAVAGVVTLVVKWVDVRYGAERDRIDQATRFRDELRKEIEALRNEVRQLRDDVKMAEAEADGWKQKYFETLQQLGEWKVKAATLQAEVDELKAEVGEVQAKLQAVENGQRKGK